MEVAVGINPSKTRQLTGFIVVFVSTYSGDYCFMAEQFVSRKAAEDTTPGWWLMMMMGSREFENLETS